jgi:hypothetical protein
MLWCRLRPAKSLSRRWPCGSAAHTRRKGKSASNNPCNAQTSVALSTLPASTLNGKLFGTMHGAARRHEGARVNDFATSTTMSSVHGSLRFLDSCSALSTTDCILSVSSFASSSPPPKSFDLVFKA